MMSSGEAAQQAKQAAMQANYDAKKFPCGPWLDGARGGPWVHVFKPAFENAMREKTDQFSSLYEHFISETAYGARRGPKVVDFNTFVAACKILFNQRSRAARS